MFSCENGLLKGRTPVLAVPSDNSYVLLANPVSLEDDRIIFFSIELKNF